MATPFKNLTVPKKNANDYEQTKQVVVGPRPQKNPMENTERDDVVPDHPPEIPWPKAEPVDSKPMKLNR